MRAVVVGHGGHGIGHGVESLAVIVGGPEFYSACGAPGGASWTAGLIAWERLSLALPACLVIFDLLAWTGWICGPGPTRNRRRTLEKLLHCRLPAGLVLMPMSSEAAVAEA